MTGAGTSPEALSFNPAATKLFVQTGGSNSITVIDPITNTIITVITVGTGPFQMAFNSDGTKLYVTNTGTNKVSVIDPNANTVIGAISVGSVPGNIAFDLSGTNLYVCNTGSSNVSVINPISDTVIATIPVGSSPGQLAFDPSSTQLYVGNFASQNISVIDTSSNTVIATVPVGSNPFGVAISPNGINVKASSNKDIYQTDIYNAISWKAPIAFIPEQYFIYRNRQFVEATTALSFQDHNLQPNTTYSYRVEAQNNSALPIFPCFGGLSFINLEIGNSSVKTKR
jgi:YVTN family beta-propeller protein